MEGYNILPPSKYHPDLPAYHDAYFNTKEDCMFVYVGPYEFPNGDGWCRLLSGVNIHSVSISFNQRV